MKKYITNKLQHYPERMTKYLNGGIALPITAQLQITNRCQYNCVYCDKRKDQGELTIDNKLVDRLKELGILSVIMTGGEPLLFKGWKNGVDLLSNHFKIGVVTTLYKYHKTLETIPKWVKVSLDTIDRAKYKKIKGFDGLPKVIENIKRLFERKSKDTTLGLQLVLCDDNKNIDMIFGMYDALKNVCDYMQIRPREEVEPYKYQEKDYQMLQILEQNCKKMIISDKFFCNQLYEDCYARWVHLVVDVEGDVVLCCNRVREKIANIYDSELLTKIKNYKVDMSKCYNPCVMSMHNNYIFGVLNGEHKEFV